MPYSSVKEARDSVSSLKGMTTSQVKHFIRVFNAMTKDGTDESTAIPVAIKQAKGEKMSKNLDTKEENIDIVEDFEEVLLKSSLQQKQEMLKLLYSELDNKQDNISVLTKAVNEEQRLALFVALPALSEDDDEYDLHTDTYNEEEVRKAMLSYNEHCMKAGLYHLYETENAKVVQSYLAPVDFNIVGNDGEERLIKKGSWLQEWYFPETEEGDKIWKKVKDGELNGISIQCNASIEDIEE